ncbi:hypothetical protein JI76_28665 [Streptomyces anulatus]|uniref:hypothetical protein n=1 Tax=Streptomyces anulatus TaxID=1892 RepID=UPI0006D95E13|nr:hypothetical protein [Streptomyces anulatus]KPL29092.1 hypothetical protein JI76_28665 [Streptomyces anulatus]
MGDTFGGEYRRPRADGVGCCQRELQDRAYYDQAPRAGVSCLLIALPISLAMWAGLLTGARALIGAIA